MLPNSCIFKEIREWVLGMDLEYSYARQKFDVVLLKAHGESFQDFFSQLMEREFPNDFVRVKPHGNKGDGGCDGWLDSKKAIFQCYAPKSLKLDVLTKKIENDFKAAKEKWPTMKEWIFVHNFYDGIPAPALMFLEELQSKNSDIKIGKMGPADISIIFESLLKKDFHSNTHALIGPVPSNDKSIDLSISDIENVILALSSIVDHDYSLEAVKPVSNQKLEWNKLSPHKKTLVFAGRQHSGTVKKYLAEGIEADLGEEIAKGFRDQYKNLKSYNVAGDIIFDELFAYTLGNLPSNPKNIISAQAVLSYYFDACDIFEDIPQGNISNAVTN